MKKGMVFVLLFLITSIFLTGCAYPEDKLLQNQIPYEDQINSVQTAVDKYQEDSGGLLPIKTKENETPIYRKYLLDFKKLIPQYMAEAPGNAYESGGIFQYVLIDVETDPTVKIFDLRIAETIRDINLRISMQDYPPYKDVIDTNVFTLDFSKLGFKEEPKAMSPYTNEELPFVINGSGEIFVDYRTDLYRKRQEEGLTLAPGEDIRHILVKDSMFVPAYSMPYTVDPESDEIIFLVN